MGDRLILIDAAAPQKSAQLTHRCQGWSRDLLRQLSAPFLFRTLIIIDYQGWSRDLHRPLSVPFLFRTLI